jgi:Raf kinase inhibitor-like YbhB/YbcL family protein
MVMATRVLGLGISVWALCASACGDNSSSVNQPAAGKGPAGMGSTAGTAASAGSGGANAAGTTSAAGTAGRSSAGTGGSAAGASGAAGSKSPTAGMAAAASGGVGAGSGGNAAQAGAGGGSAAGAFAITSPVVKEGEMIPAEYRCQKPSPALDWTAGPAGTKSYAIVFKDVTPGAVSLNYKHWIIYDIPASVMALPMGVPAGATITMPVMAKQGKNYSMNPQFAGPCGGMNMYKFTLYAIDTEALPDVPANATGDQVETALEGSHKLGTATLNIKSMP